MTSALARPLPSWLDPSRAPGPTRSVPLRDGTLQVVDAGQGPAVVLVHGTPSWSVDWRYVIADLSRDHRVIAVDHLGFGLSDKPADADYRFEVQARRLGEALDALGVGDFHLVVTDVGGPIGLGMAVERPERVRGVAVWNSFCWDLRPDWFFWLGGTVLGSRLGRWLYLRHNVSPRFIAPSAWGSHRPITEGFRADLVGPFPDPASRVALWATAVDLLACGAWADTVAARLPALAHGDHLIAWGMADTAFAPRLIARWQSLLPGAALERWEKVGHFPQEEAPELVIPALRRWLTQRTGTSTGHSLSTNQTVARAGAE